MQSATVRERVGPVVLVYPETEPWRVRVVGPHGPDAANVNLLASRMARAAAMRSASIPLPEGILDSFPVHIVKTEYKGLEARGQQPLAEALAKRYDVPPDMLVE